MARQRIQPIIINLNFFSKLIDLLGELANIFEEDKSTFDVLEKISVLALAYSVTGNGYFLQ